MHKLLREVVAPDAEGRYLNSTLETLVIAPATPPSAASNIRPQTIPLGAIRYGGRGGLRARSRSTVRGYPGTLRSTLRERETNPPKT